MKKLIAAVLAFFRKFIYTNFDNGMGSSLGRFFYFRIGGNRIMQAIYKGPGKATAPGQNCGHSFPYRCNSGHCNKVWCKNAHSLLMPWGFRVWLGPSYNRKLLKEWKQGFNHIKRCQRVYNNSSGTYSLFRISRY